MATLQERLKKKKKVAKLSRKTGVRPSAPHQQKINLTSNLKTTVKKDPVKEVVTPPKVDLTKSTFADLPDTKTNLTSPKTNLTKPTFIDLKKDSPTTSSTQTRVVRNKAFDALTEEERSRSQAVGAFQSSRGEFLPGVTEEQKAAFDEFFVPSTIEEPAGSGLQIDPFFGQKKASGGQGQGTIQPSQADVFLSANTARAQNKNEQEFLREMQIERRERQRLGLAPVSPEQRVDQARRGQDLVFQKQTEFNIKEARTAYLDRKKSEIIAATDSSNFPSEIKRMQDEVDRINKHEADNPSLLGDNDVRIRSLYKQNIERMQNGLPPISEVKESDTRNRSGFRFVQNDPLSEQELLKDFEGSREHQSAQKKSEKYKAENLISDEDLLATEKEYEKRLSENLAAKGSQFDVSFGDKLLDDFAEKKRQLQADRVIEDEKTRIEQLRKNEITRVQDLSKQATTQEAADRFLAKEMSRIDNLYGTEGFEKDGDLLMKRRRELDLSLERSREDFALQKEASGINDIIKTAQANIKAGIKGDSLTAKKNAEQINFIRAFAEKDKGDVNTVLGRALNAYKKAISDDVKLSEELMFQNIDELVFDEGFDRETTLETATRQLNNDSKKARKYMETRGFHDSDIEEQLENYKINVLGYTKEELESEKLVRVTLKQMQDVVDGSMTDPLEVATMLDREKNGMTISQKKNFIDTALASPDTDDSIKAYLRQVRPLIAGVDKPKSVGAKAAKFSALDVQIGDEFFARNPDLTVAEITEGFAGINEEKIPTGKVKTYLYKKVLERIAEEELSAEEFKEVKENLKEVDIPEESAPGFFESLSNSIKEFIGGKPEEIKESPITPDEGFEDSVEGKTVDDFTDDELEALSSEDLQKVIENSE